MDTKKNNILIPIDFSEQSLLALEESYSISRMVNAEITLLHVIIESSPFWSIFTAKEKEDVGEKYKKKLDEFAEVISKKTGIKVNTIVEKGKLIDKIIEITDRLNTRFLIVGTIIRDNLKERLIGSNSIRLVREAKCPVITIKGKRTSRDCRKVVLPLDLTKETKQKVGHAVNVAKYFRSTVYAISVSTSKDSHLVARLENQLDQVKKIIEKQGIDCVTKFIKAGASSDSLAKQILNQAYEIDGDLMVIMTQQENKITENFIGSTAKEIIHTSEIPVVSITPK
ncbi:MAG: universal stress protein [Bacteroidia bacterium]|nr:universal stress protein [Bacteroidia bacterium]